MDTQLFTRFAPVIRLLSRDELDGAPSVFEKLTVAEQNDLRVCYAPFEYVNPQARVVVLAEPFEDSRFVRLDVVDRGD